MADDPDVSAERVLWWGGDSLPPQAAERRLLVESIAKAGLPRCATTEQLARGRHAPHGRVQRRTGRAAASLTSRPAAAPYFSST